MIRLKYLFQRILPHRGSAPKPAPPSRSSVDTDEVTRLVVERLSEDEMLRGNLTDRGFAPVLAFVTSMVPAATRAASSSTGGDVEEAVSHGARGLVRAIVTAAESGEVQTLAEQLGPPIFSADAVERARRSITTSLPTTSSPDERAIAIVAALKASLEGKA
jgi:hypothetical protein